MLDYICGIFGSRLESISKGLIPLERKFLIVYSVLKVSPLLILAAGGTSESRWCCLRNPLGPARRPSLVALVETHNLDEPEGAKARG